MGSEERQVALIATLPFIWARGSVIEGRSVPPLWNIPIPYVSKAGVARIMPGTPLLIHSGSGSEAVTNTTIGYSLGGRYGRDDISN
jgi:hypothetical protein